MPKELLSKTVRDRMRQQVSTEALIDPTEDLGWLIGAVVALLDHADRMDDWFAGDGDHSDRRGHG